MEITVEQLKEKLQEKKDFLLLDVRTPQEYQQWSIPGSVNMPMQIIDSNKLPKDKEIIAMCAHGMRSQYAAQILKSQGFNASSVEGGMSAWNSVYDLVPLIEKDFKLFQIKRIGKGCLGYFLVAGNTGIAVDPTTHVKTYLDIAEKLGCQIKAVIDTHQHADHVSGSRSLSRLTKSELFINSLDGYKFSGYKELKDKWIMNINGLDIKVVHTPGHTAGSTSLLVDNFLLTGDILFTDGVARPDLKDKAEEYAAQLYDTYQNKILNLSNSTIVAPAHSRNASTLAEPVTKTLDWIKKNNRALELSKSEFIKYVIANIPQKPQNYEDIIAANHGDVEWTEDEIQEMEFGANRCVVPTG